MIENQGTQEKDFRSILNSILQLGEQRDKLINELDEIIDRIKQNRRPCEGKEQDTSLTQKSPDDIISTLKYRLSEMDQANERLKLISNRLNELA